MKYAEIMDLIPEIGNTYGLNIGFNPSLEIIAKNRGKDVIIPVETVEIYGGTDIDVLKVRKYIENELNWTFIRFYTVPRGGQIVKQLYFEKV